MNVSEKDEEEFYSISKQNLNQDLFPDRETECKLLNDIYF